MRINCMGPVLALIAGDILFVAASPLVLAPSKSHQSLESCPSELPDCSNCSVCNHASRSLLKLGHPFLARSPFFPLGIRFIFDSILQFVGLVCTILMKTLHRHKCKKFLQSRRWHAGARHLCRLFTLAFFTVFLWDLTCVEAVAASLLSILFSLDHFEAARLWSVLYGLYLA